MVLTTDQRSRNCILMTGNARVVYIVTVLYILLAWLACLDTLGTDEGVIDARSQNHNYILPQATVRHCVISMWLLSKHHHISLPPVKIYHLLWIQVISTVFIYLYGQGNFSKALVEVGTLQAFSNILIFCLIASAVFTWSITLLHYLCTTKILMNTWHQSLHAFFKCCVC